MTTKSEPSNTELEPVLKEPLHPFARTWQVSYPIIVNNFAQIMLGIIRTMGWNRIAATTLCSWNLRMQRDSVPAALFEIFYMQLATLLLKDFLGAAAEQYLTNGDAQRIFFHRLAHQPDSHWWKIKTPHGGVLTQQEILLQALTNTVEWFNEQYKQDMQQWNWGRLHTTTFVSNPLGRSGIKLLESLVNRGPFAVDGSNIFVLK